MDQPSHQAIKGKAAVAFSGSPIDRADNIRVDREKLGALMNWRAKVLMLDGLLPQIDDQGGLVWGTLADVSEDTELVFLGLLDEKACFAPVPESVDGSGPANPRSWQVMHLLRPEELAIYGGARSLTDWHARHQFCAKCGSPTKIAKGGWQRSCDNCGASLDSETEISPSGDFKCRYCNSWSNVNR